MARPKKEVEKNQTLRLLIKQKNFNFLVENEFLLDEVYTIVIYKRIFCISFSYLDNRYVTAGTVRNWTL